MPGAQTKKPPGLPGCSKMLSCGEGLTRDRERSFSVPGQLPSPFDRRRRARDLDIPFTIAGMSDWLIVLTAMEPASLTRSVVEQVYAIDRDQPVM